MEKTMKVAAAQSIRQFEIKEIIPSSSLNHTGYSGKGFVEIGKDLNTAIPLQVMVKEPGRYAIDFRYANGNGPTNTSNKCAIRTLKNGTTIVGTVVLLQRSNDEWRNWGFTNSIQLNLSGGVNNLTLSFEPWNDNKNGDINQAMLDYCRIIKLK